MRACEYFARARVAAETLGPAVRSLAALREARDDVVPWVPTSYGGGSARGAYSDPTASMAERRMSSDIDGRVQTAQREVDALEETVGEMLRLLDAIRTDMGDRHALVMELYYVDLLPTWSEVAWELRCSLKTVQRIRDSVLDHVDSIGVSGMLASASGTK